MAEHKKNVGKKDKIHYPKANTEHDRDRTGMCTVILEYPEDGIFKSSKGGMKFAGHIKNPAVIANMMSKTPRAGFQIVQNFVGGPDVKKVEPAEVKAKREEEEARARKKAS